MGPATSARRHDPEAGWHEVSMIDREGRLDAPLAHEDERDAVDEVDPVRGLISIALELFQRFAFVPRLRAENREDARGEDPATELGGTPAPHALADYVQRLGDGKGAREQLVTRAARLELAPNGLDALVVLIGRDLPRDPGASVYEDPLPSP